MAARANTVFGNNLDDPERNYKNVLPPNRRKAMKAKSVIPQCPKGWLKFQTNCYYFSADQQPWEMAMSSCQSLKAHLVVIDDKNDTDKQEFLDHLKNSSYWIGLRRYPKVKWMWINGRPFPETYLKIKREMEKERERIKNSEITQASSKTRWKRSLEENFSLHIKDRNISVIQERQLGCDIDKMITSEIMRRKHGISSCRKRPDRYKLYKTYILKMVINTKHHLLSGCFGVWITHSGWEEKKRDMALELPDHLSHKADLWGWRPMGTRDSLTNVEVCGCAHLTMLADDIDDQAVPHQTQQQDEGVKERHEPSIGQKRGRGLLSAVVKDPELRPDLEGACCFLGLGADGVTLPGGGGLAHPVAPGSHGRQGLRSHTEGQRRGSSTVEQPGFQATWGCERTPFQQRSRTGQEGAEARSPFLLRQPKSLSLFLAEEVHDASSGPTAKVTGCPK
ncbi:C-type lectin domain family 4 member E, partial [Ophiophagus hannah]